MSLNLNKVTVAGFVGKDPKVEYLPSGMCKATFQIATNESYKDKSGNKVDKTTWHNVQFWGKPAEIIEKYVAKGTSLYVEGKIENFSWEDKSTKEKKYMTIIKGETFQFIGGVPKTSSKSDDPVREQEDHSNNIPEGFDDLPF